MTLWYGVPNVIASYSEAIQNVCSRSCSSMVPRNPAMECGVRDAVEPLTPTFGLSLWIASLTLAMTGGRLPAKIPALRLMRIKDAMRVLT